MSFVMRFAWPADVLEEDDGVTVTFPDVPGAITWGQTRSEATEKASDALVSILSSMIEGGEPIPQPSAPDGRSMISMPALDAAKVALHMTMLERKISNVELGRLMGLDEKAIRRLRDPLHSSHIENVARALRLLGRRLEVQVLEEGAESDEQRSKAQVLESA